MNNDTFQTFFFSRYQNDKNFQNAISFFTTMKEAADKLMVENDELKKKSDDDIFAEKNQEIERLKRELSRKQHVSCYSFSDEKLKDLDKWYNIHISDPLIQKKMSVLKNSGHHPTYEITPTEVGYWYGIRCSCGASYGAIE